MRIFYLISILALSACDMGHLGNPVMWPAMAAGNAVENATYNARRGKVEKHVASHQAEIVTDIRNGGGPALTKGADLARVPPSARPEMLRIFKQDIAKFSPNTEQGRELLVIWFMVHGK